jgi:hypothetical protein
MVHWTGRRNIGPSYHGAGCAVAFGDLMAR